MTTITPTNQTTVPLNTSTNPPWPGIPYDCCEFIDIKVSNDVAQLYPLLQSLYKYIGIQNGHGSWQMENVDSSSNYILFYEDGYWKIIDDFDYSGDYADDGVIQQGTYSESVSCPTDVIDWRYFTDEYSWTSTSYNNQYINITCSGRQFLYLLWTWAWFWENHYTLKNLYSNIFF